MNRRAQIAVLCAVLLVAGGAGYIVGAWPRLSGQCEVDKNLMMQAQEMCDKRLVVYNIDAGNVTNLHREFLWDITMYEMMLRDAAERKMTTRDTTNILELCRSTREFLGWHRLQNCVLGDIGTNRQTTGAQHGGGGIAR